ncbi:hypothetical protein [Lactobacillus intestinalis]|uniref:hypothetical protein n=1 Tax=Lactobacillus intestinalis TaxID=151781 RepID=UPI0025A58E22|nr:hypothetical protein [Lactobacillus intestinalis]
MKLLFKFTTAAILSVSGASAAFMTVGNCASIVQASTSYTYGESQIYSGVSSASTNRIHATHGYKVHISQASGQRVRFKVFRYGSEVHSRVAVGPTTVNYSGFVDYSVRVYNNSRNSLKAGVSISAN